MSDKASIAFIQQPLQFKTLHVPVMLLLKFLVTVSVRVNPTLRYMHKSRFPAGSSGLTYMCVRAEFNIISVEQQIMFGQTSWLHLILSMFKKKCQSSIPLAHGVNQQFPKPDTYPDLITNLC